MGKGGDIWDDSALIRAYDDAVSKYKRMHRMGDGDLAPQADDETTNGGENLQADGNVAEHSETIENPSSKGGSSTKYVAASPRQTGEFELTTIHELRSDNKDEPAPYPNSQEEYSQLLENYYNIEYQRQNILEQLNRYGYWNNQNPAASTSYPEQMQASPLQPLASVSCNCLYGCQNWILPCHASVTDNSHTTISRDARKGPHGSSDIVKTATDAARKAMSSLKLVNANEGKDSNGLGPFIDNVSENSVAGSSTDLAVVLNAWYNAGFHTGKYLSEQSLEKKKDEHG